MEANECSGCGKVFTPEDTVFQIRTGYLILLLGEYIFDEEKVVGNYCTDCILVGMVKGTNIDTPTDSIT